MTGKPDIMHSRVFRRGPPRRKTWGHSALLQTVQDVIFPSKCEAIAFSELV